MIKMPMQRFLTASVEILKIRQSAVRLHLSFVALAAFLFFADPGAEGALKSLRLLGILFVCVSTHAVASRAAGRLAGGKIEAPLLWPLGNLAHDPKPASVTVVTAAATGGLLGLMVLYALFAYAGPSFARRTAAILLLANLVPASPFDAGRVLRAWLIQIRGPAWGWRVSASIAFLAAVFLCVAGTVTGVLSLLAVAVFMACWNAVEWRAEMRALETPAWDAEEYAMFAPEEGEAAGSLGTQKRLRTSRSLWGGLRIKILKRRARRAACREADVRKRVDALLAKVTQVGIQNLTPWERLTLKRASRQYRKFLRRDGV